MPLLFCVFFGPGYRPRGGRRRVSPSPPPRDLRAGAGPKSGALGTIQVELMQASPPRWGCQPPPRVDGGTASRGLSGPWAWSGGFFTETDSVRPLPDPGGSGGAWAEPTASSFESLPLSVPSTVCRHLQETVWQHWPSVHNDNSRATTGQEGHHWRSPMALCLERLLSEAHSFHSAGLVRKAMLPAQPGCPILEPR